MRELVGISAISFGLITVPEMADVVSINGASAVTLICWLVAPISSRGLLFHASLIGSDDDFGIRYHAPVDVHDSAADSCSSFLPPSEARRASQRNNREDQNTECGAFHRHAIAPSG
jgi:hypothetical protein